MSDGASGVQRMYVNGFELSLSNSDIILTLMLAGVPTHVTHLSFTTAKTLSDALKETVGQLEAATKRPIMKMDEISKGLEKLAEDGAIVRPGQEITS